MPSGILRRDTPEGKSSSPVETDNRKEGWERDGSKRGVVDSNQPPLPQKTSRLVRGLSRRFRGWCRGRFWTLYDLSRRKPLRDLRDLYPHVLALPRSRDKDYKSVDSGNTLATLAGVGDTDVVLLTDFDRLVEGTGTSSETSSIAISSALSETHFLSHILPLFHPMDHG